MSGKLKIAIAQNSIGRDIADNGTNIRQMMSEASNAGARLVHFPEGALSGNVKSEITNWASFDWELLSSELEETARHARRLGVWLVLGCPHDLQFPNRPYNSLYAISDQGEIIGGYNKRYCSHTEISNWFSIGDSPFVFDVDGFRLGCALCIEIHFPELFAEYEELNADAVLFSAYSSDPMFWIETQGHAAINNLWISVCVPAQCSNDLPGGLIGPDGYELARCGTTKAPQIQLAELNKADSRFETALSKARPWRRLAREGHIYKPRLRRED